LNGRHAAKDWSFEMYNEKNRNAFPFSRTPMQDDGSASSHRGQTRDIPLEDRLDSMQPRLDRTQPRRRCDGSLRSPAEPDSLHELGGRRLGDSARNSMDAPCRSDCTRGACGGWGIESRPLAMVYSPCQAWRDAYPPDIALSRGTLFSELDLPFEAKKCKRGCSL